MKLWVIGDDVGGLLAHIDRYLPLEIAAGRPHGNGRHVVVWIGPNVDDDILASPGNELFILVEPGWRDRDRVVRRLAGAERPRLEFIEHVGYEILAERTWAITLSLLAGTSPAVDAVRIAFGGPSDLVTGPPTGGSWLKLRPPVALHGLTLGFIGFRPMAWRIAGWADQMGMRVVYATQGSDRECAIDRESAALRGGAIEAAFDEVLTTSDVIILDVEYADDSIRVIDAPELSLMPPGAWLVNTAHGRAIDEGALIQALRDGRLSGVALDRFNYEPLPADSPLRGLDMVMLTPGIAAPESRAILERMAQRIAALVSDLHSDIPVRRVRRAVPRVSSGRRR